MNFPQLSPNAAKGLVRLILLTFVLYLGLFLYVFSVNYDARQDIVVAARKACELTKQDRESAVILTDNVLQAFRDTDRRNPNPLTTSRIEALKSIEANLIGLRERSKVDCMLAFPSTRFFP